jgi:hypothetical protein
MSDLDRELDVYAAMKPDLERESLGRWVLIRQDRVEGIFDDFDSAATSAIDRFGRGPYLIRQVGAPDVILPASAMYVFANG